MKYINAAALAIAAVLLLGALAPPAQADVSFDVAYSDLSHHGTWLVSAQYGRVWQPRIYTQEWSPYYDGHWVYTEMGWTWVSDYEWGAIPYHYGTWVADPRAGWVWIPGNVWAPAWVVFRTGPDYIGWAPVPPGFSVGVSMDMGGPSSFVFVSSRDFLAPRLRGSIIPRDRANLFINKTTIVNNITVQNNVVINRGPDFKIVEKATGRTIREERIESVSRVAPFEHVSRAQLAVDPARVKHGLRAAEPVPESRALPVSGKRAEGERNSSPDDASRPRNRHPEARPNPGAATTTADVPSNGPADTVQKQRGTQTPSRAPAASSSNPKGNADAKQSAKAQPKGKTKAGARAKKDTVKKGQDSDKGAAPDAKDGAHQ